MKKISQQLARYYTQQLNARAMVPNHPEILARWARQSQAARLHADCQSDLAYGDAADERLDFFRAKHRGAPLLVFIHGGWWRTLDKADFSFVAPPFIDTGVNVALTNYTLAPAASIREIVRQQLRALAWLYRNADTLGFDRDRIVVAGHSAGAHLAAMMMAALWPVYDAHLPYNLIKAGILLSGLYDLKPVLSADFVNTDLKLRPQDIAPLSPANLPQAQAIPFVTAAGGLESEEFRRQTALIGQAWKTSHLGEIRLPHADHFTICDSFATPGQALCDIGTQLAATIS